MWILVIILIGVVIFGLIAGFFYNRSIQKKIERGELKEAPEIKTVDEECCGQHEICEKVSKIKRTLSELLINMLIVVLGTELFPLRIVLL